MLVLLEHDFNYLFTNMKICDYMQSKKQLELKFVKNMLDYITSQLVGSSEEYKRFEEERRPSDLIIAGNLTYRKVQNNNSEEKKIIDDEEEFVELDDEEEIDELDDEEEENPNIQTTKKSSMDITQQSVSCLIQKDQEGLVKIIPKFSVFYKTFPTYEEQMRYYNLSFKKTDESMPIATIWKRIDFNGDEIEIIVEKKDDVSIVKHIKLEKIYSKIEEDSDYFLKIALSKKEKQELNLRKLFDEENPENKQQFQDLIKKLVNSQKISKICYSSRNFPWEVQVEVLRENYSNKFDLITFSLSNIHDVVKNEHPINDPTIFNTSLQIKLPHFKLDPFSHSITYDEETVSFKKIVRGINCNPIYNKKDKTIFTESIGIFEQIRISPVIAHIGISTKFNDFKSEHTTDFLEKIYDFYKKWIDIKKKSSSIDSYQKAIKHHEKNLNYYRNGLNSIYKDKEAKLSFQLMQETFSNSSKYQDWRLFQIIFIVMQISSIVDPNKRDIAHILHVQTGGGKSEAYFGIVVFTLFYDRLRNKDYGVSGFSKFPLRMLSIQQLQRIVGIIAHAERIRKREKIGKIPFSLGYFVGISEDFPRENKTIIDKINDKKKLGENLNGKIIEECPFCNSKVILHYDEIIGRIIHKCTNKDCAEVFYIYFTQEDVYRQIPSFIISTVDKLSVIGWNRRAKTLFGARFTKCPEGHGYIPIGDKCLKEDCDETGLDLQQSSSLFAPTLMIQDEMHLISEGFGTINSHFESFFNALVQNFSNQSLKYIAMTATVTGAKNHIKQLYQRDLHIFPGYPIGEKGIDDFFYNIENVNGEPEIQRLILGLKPNRRDNQYASLVTLLHISRYLTSCWKNSSVICKEYGVTKDEFLQILTFYQSYLGYFLKKADVHSIEYYLSLIVNDKLSVDNFHLSARTLTGDNSLDEIKDSIRWVEESPKSFLKDANLNVIFATSVVSHGVDIENWNFMFFQGIPRRTAEYIQSLSRVGRQHIGLIFVWFYPNRVRDLSFYQYFNEYHEILDKKVEPIPISRWATLGIKQTINTLFSAAILNYYSEVIGRPIYKVEDINQIFSEESKRKEIINFLWKAYNVEHPIKPEQIYYKEQIEIEVERRFEKLSNYKMGKYLNYFVMALGTTPEPYFKNQMGMRGIQDSLLLTPHYQTKVFSKKYNRDEK